MPIYFGSKRVVNASFCRAYFGNKLKYACNPLTFTSVGTSTVGYTITGSLPDINIQVSTDNNVWVDWDGDAITLLDGQKLYVRNTANTLSTSNDNYLQFFMTGSINASGNTNSMINYAPISAYCFEYLFYDCASLKTLPELPSTNIAQACYGYMFRGTGITEIPDNYLKSSSLAQSCYYAMFAACVNLTTIGRNLLKATTSGYASYRNMFSGCTSLVDVPNDLLINHTSTTTQMMQSMFNGCTSLAIPPSMAHFTTISGSNAMRSMFNGCSSLNISEDSGDHLLITIPSVVGSTAITDMFKSTSGSFEGTPQLEHSYYYNN